MPASQKRTLSNLLVARLVPHEFLAKQLRRPSGRFGRYVMTRGLNDGNAQLIDATLDALAINAGESLLDVGFGGGYALERSSQRTTGALWGVDFSPDMVVAARARLAALLARVQLNLLSADVTALLLRDALVDAVCTTNTIYFWSEPARAFAELARVTKPGGRIAFGYTGRAKMERFKQITQHGFRTFEPDELERLLRASGLSQVSTVALNGSVTEGDYVTLVQR